MMVSHEKRVLFVHVQKTGGSTIDRMLEEAIPDVAYLQGLRGGRHATARMPPCQREHGLRRRRTNQMNVKFNLGQGRDKHFECVHARNANILWDRCLSY